MPAFLLLTFRGTLRHQSSIGRDMISPWRHPKLGTLLRLEWHKGKAPSMVISAACRAHSRRTAPDKHQQHQIMAVTEEREQTSKPCSLREPHPFIKTLSMCPGQMPQNQVLQKPQHTHRKKCQPPHPATAAGARWEAGVVKKGGGKTQKFKKSTLTSPSRTAA